METLTWHRKAECVGPRPCPMWIGKVGFGALDVVTDRSAARVERAVLDEILGATAVYDHVVDDICGCNRRVAGYGELEGVRSRFRDFGVAGTGERLAPARVCMVDCADHVCRRAMGEAHFGGKMLTCVNPSKIRERHAVEPRLVKGYLLLRKRSVRRRRIADGKSILAGIPVGVVEESAHVVVPAKANPVVGVRYVAAGPVGVGVAGVADARVVGVGDGAFLEARVLHEVHVTDAHELDFVEGVAAFAAGLRLRELQRV